MVRSVVVCIEGVWGYRIFISSYCLVMVGGISCVLYVWWSIVCFIYYNWIIVVGECFIFLYIFCINGSIFCYVFFLVWVCIVRIYSCFVYFLEL